MGRAARCTRMSAPRPCCDDYAYAVEYLAAQHLAPTDETPEE